MPRRSKRPCAQPGCIALIDQGRYCETHRTSLLDERPSSSERGYGATWQRLRLIILRRDPICQDPFGIHATLHEVAPSTDVDHIVAKRDGGQDEESNLQGLCHSCHSHKTKQQTEFGKTNIRGRSKSLKSANY